MIEVEKKFSLSEEDEARLLAGAEFLGEKNMEDAYYDTPDLKLSLKDWWLRLRNGRYELKIGIHSRPDRIVDQYDELEDETAIKKALNIESGDSFAEAIAKLGYAPFCVSKTTRRKYKKEGFGIDLDIVEFAEFNYKIAEIELMVEDEVGLDEAANKIIHFAEENGLKVGHVRGKVREYLMRERPDHYAAMIKAGIMKE